MSWNPDRLPSYCKHKSTGQAYVTLNGIMHYLGSYGSKESRQEYDRLLKEWLDNGRRLPDPEIRLSVNDMILAYMRYARVRYKGSNDLGCQGNPHASWAAAISSQLHRYPGRSELQDAMECPVRVAGAGQTQASPNQGPCA